jgi:hypothetical protein
MNKKMGKGHDAVSKEDFKNQKVSKENLDEEEDA